MPGCIMGQLLICCIYAETEKQRLGIQTIPSLLVAGSGFEPVTSGLLTQRSQVHRPGGEPCEFILTA